LAATVYAGADAADRTKYTPAQAVDVAAQILAAVDARIAGPQPAAAAAKEEEEKPRSTRK